MKKSRNRYFNPNPQKREVGDCVVRALCAATGRTWDEVFSDLSRIAFRLKCMPNDQIAYREYLTENGWVRTPISNKKGSKRPTVEEMAKRSADGQVYLCEVANHLVTAKEGAYFDTWESGYKSLYGFWTKKTADPPTEGR